MKRKTGILFKARAAAMLLAVMLTATTARAQTYTVTLKAGDGTGSDITISNSDPANVATTMQAANEGQFWQEGSDWWFKLPGCPGSFTAPSEKTFKEWHISGSGYDSNNGPGGAFQLSGDLTLTAQWVVSSFNFSIPSPIAITYGDTQTAFDIQITSASFLEDYNIIFFNLYDASFTCTAHDGTIPFTITSNGNNARRGSSSIGDLCYVKITSSIAMPYTFQGFVNISSDDWAVAAPGIYTATLNWRWSNSGGGDGNGSITLTLTVSDPVSLADDADNSTAISAANGNTCDVTLTGRTLYRDGDWNTLCLPFNATKTGPLAGATIKELDTQTAYSGHMTGLDGTTLYLNFKDVESIVAGRPYIVKWGTDDQEPIINPSNDFAAALGFISEVPTFDGGQASNWNADNEGPAKLVDGDTGTKYGLSNANPWVEFHYASAITPKGYALWTANDSQGARNPTSWTIKAKNSGDADWTTLTTVGNWDKDKLPMANNQRTIFALDNTESYQYFRFEATKGSEFQLAELQFCTVEPAMSDIVNPLFTGVTIDASAPTAVTSADGTVSFVGSYDNRAFTEADRSILFLGAANTLYYPQSGASIGAFRAHFELDGITAGNPSAGVRAFKLNFGDGEATEGDNFGDGEATGIRRPAPDPCLNGGAWYDMSGRRLSGRPTKKGVYVNNGQKIIIK